MDFRVVIGQVLKGIRIAQDQTQECLAGKVGITREAISQIETGKRGNNLLTLKKIANALGYKLSEVIRQAEDLV